MSLLDKKSSIKTDAIFSNKKDIELYDAELWESFQKEMVRQEEHIELIASENYASKRVLQAQGSVLTNKYAEGYPEKNIMEVVNLLILLKNLPFKGHVICLRLILQMFNLIRDHKQIKPYTLHC